MSFSDGLVISPCAHTTHAAQAWLAHRRGRISARPMGRTARMSDGAGGRAAGGWWGPGDAHLLGLERVRLRQLIRRPLGGLLGLHLCFALTDCPGQRQHCPFPPAVVPSFCKFEVDAWCQPHNHI